MGHRIAVVDMEPGGMGLFARPSGVSLDYKTGLLHGGVDVFSRSIALGY
jgi:hypothetical protein